MEVYQPLDFSNAVPMSAILAPSPSPRSPAGPASPPLDIRQPMSVLDLCVRRPSPSPRSSPHSPHSPRSSPHSPRSLTSPLYHPYLTTTNNNNNNCKSVNQNDIKSQLLMRAKMEADATSRPSLPSPPAYPHAELPDAGSQMSMVPALSVLQQRLLPRSATSAFAPAVPASPSATSPGLPLPAPRRRRTSSGLPDSPLGSSDDRSSTAASPSPPSPPSSLDLLGSLGPLALAPGYGGVLPMENGLPLPQQVTVSAAAAAATKNGKPTRPFKAYPKDPLSLAAGVAVNAGTLGAAEAALGRASNEAYAEFRRRMLAQVQAAIPSKAKKTAQQQHADSATTPYSEAAAVPAVDSTHGLPGGLASSPESAATPADSKDGKDAAYWERRRKNNEAAKRSRDARRAKEDEIAIRAAFLEQENLKLKYEVAALRNETAKLRCLLYSGTAEC
ncbi:hypothetical protein ONE63_002180 [Megalurothrips usitatus]|uniref:BZIP domain-containing protein n=1 Tax=Megalurothrips usitatus TaxID=439358 RepID=A0AAV7XAR8_9NEOP|nr:hypothetical protein ONE63_002180 [Megalurothrips usitatus]